MSSFRPLLTAYLRSTLSSSHSRNMKSDRANAAKGLNCVLPNPRSIMLICLLMGGQMYNHLAAQAKYAQKAEPDAACVARFGSVFPFCLPATSQAEIGNVKLSHVQKADYEETPEQL